MSSTKTSAASSSAADSPSAIGVIGAGSMGQALIAGWADSGHQTIAVVRDRAKYQHLEGEYGIAVTEDRTALAGCSIVVLAIKPQVIREILSDFAPVISPDAVVISVAAGITTDFIENALGSTDQIIRAMPNTPSIIGKGVTGISGSPACTEESLSIARELMSAVGVVVEIPENAQNELAAVSGSGPAYLFYLAEYFIKGALELGLDPEVTRLLVSETLLGSAELLQASGKSPESLREQVTSPAGMTAAAMEVLDSHGVGEAVMSALTRGAERARELGGS